MKRGLKGNQFDLCMSAIPCFNHCPDEKGTERLLESGFWCRGEGVSTIDPMKI